MRAIRPVSACLMLLMLSGCAGYKLGPAGRIEAGAKTLQIDSFSNQTLEPRLGDAINAALRRSLQEDGTYRLSSGGGADIIVTGTILRYTRNILSLVPNDVLTVRDFRVNATARVIARDTVTGKVLLDRPVTGYTLVRAGSDLTSAERQALPLLADDLSRKVTALLVDGTW
jgi:predicted alpha-1,6-mannanase (GH76 family)